MARISFVSTLFHPSPVKSEEGKSRACSGYESLRYLNIIPLNQYHPAKKATHISAPITKYIAPTITPKYKTAI